MRAEPGVSRETRDAVPAPAVPRETPGILARAALAPIALYRRLLSPAIPNRCRFYPSCSAYAEEALRELGATRGLIVAAWRVLRCHPFSKGGLDPLSQRRLFRTTSEGERA